MLSTENPPPDPCEISQLKSSDHERDCVNPDLCNSVLVDNKFSIRDYVFNTRSKDIKTNWPFSLKNLELCLKHGVQDVLPPFHSLNCAKNLSTAKSAAERIYCNEGNTITLKGNNSGSNNHLVSVSSNKLDCEQRLAVDCENFISSGSEGDKLLNSTTKNQSTTEINSVPTVKTPSLETEPEILPGSSVEKSESSVPSSTRVGSLTRNPVKHGKLIVKLRNHTSEQRQKEDPAVNTFVVSETMASKVCPVCKTFSSSSNTTLNAHIDQCLSGESAISWGASSKVIKHRIKPRKTKLIVDIYKTAQRCTLEDLDRRNGTNWASNMSFPGQNIHTSAGEKNEAATTFDLDSNEEGAVYIDSSGTKLRILSKSNDLPLSSNVKDNCETGKTVKKDTGTKFLSAKKKKKLVKKHKLLNSGPPPGQSNEINDGRRRKLLAEESSKKERGLMQLPKSCSQIKVDGVGMIKQWVGSRRSGTMKKINNHGQNYDSEKWEPKDLRSKTRKSTPADPFSSASLSHDDPISPEKSKRKDEFSFDSNDELMEEPCLRKKARYFLSKSQDFHDKKKGLMLPNHRENHVSSRSHKVMEMVPAANADSSFISSRSSPHHRFSPEGKKISFSRKMSQNHAFSSGGNKLSSSRKNRLSGPEVSTLESKNNFRKRSFDEKKPQLTGKSESDEEPVLSRPTNDRRQQPSESAAPTDMISGEQKPGYRTRVLNIQRKRGAIRISRRAESMEMEIPLPSPESDVPVAENIDCCSMGGSLSSSSSDAEEFSGEAAEVSEDSNSKMVDEGAYMVLNKSLDPSDIAVPSDVPEQYVHAYNEPYPQKPVLNCPEEMFSADEVDKNSTGNADAIPEMDTGEEHDNYFAGVDPIPIPGPPGSFLPSPGRMGSEELHGNSSLTTCRIQSSGDEHHQLVDMDSSDSPVSASSTISNSITVRSNLASQEKWPEGPHVNDQTKSHFLGASDINPIVDISTPLEHPSGAGDANLNMNQPRSDLMFSEMNSDRFKNNQPCCCSRKEGALQAVGLNYQDSQLLQRRAMASIALPVREKHMVGDQMRNMNNINFNQEVLSHILKPEKHLTRLPVGFNHHLQAANHSEMIKFRSRDDYESPSPSTSNSVFRLMGKDLMVVNKEENVHPQARPAQPGTLNDPLSCISSGAISAGKVQNNDRSFRYMGSQSPPIFDHMRNSASVLDFDVNFMTSKLSPHPVMVVPSMEKVQTPIRPASDPSGFADKEIIIIDDGPEREPDSAIKAGNMKIGGSSIGTSASMALGYNSRYVEPFYGYGPGGYPVFAGSPVSQNASFQARSFNGLDANQVNWNCSRDGSTRLRPNSSMAPSSSATHLRSSVYYSPGFP